MKSKLLTTLLALSCGLNAEPTFSQKQEWDPKFEPYLQVESAFGIDWGSIELPEPPDSSVESAYLVELQKHRTPEIIRAIKAESEETLNPGQYLEPELVAIGGKANTYRVCQLHALECGIAVAKQAKAFDRARPSQVTPELLTVVATPGTPSYPSGHACLAYLTGYYLASINPASRESYLATAGTVSKNREYAGVQFPSDSYAGKTLAKLMIRKLLADSTFQSAFLASAEEWPGATPIEKMVIFKSFSLPDPKP